MSVLTSALISQSQRCERWALGADLVSKNEKYRNGDVWCVSLGDGQNSTAKKNMYTEAIGDVMRGYKLRWHGSVECKWNAYWVDTFWVDGVGDVTDHVKWKAIEWTQQCWNIALKLVKNILLVFVTLHWSLTFSKPANKINRHQLSLVLNPYRLVLFYPMAICLDKCNTNKAISLPKPNP